MFELSYKRRVLVAVLASVWLCACGGDGPVDGADAGGDTGGDAGSEDVATADDFQQVECSSVFPDHEVTITDERFEPAQLTVVVGDTVKWSHEDSGASHTVASGTADDPTQLFDSGSMSEGDEFCLEFLRTGSYEYLCEEHPQTMSGMVRVNEPL
ncbi:MAG: plastocyanin/azurin family copper-binding protein [Persicimonas sp.]